MAKQYYRVIVLFLFLFWIPLKGIPLNSSKLIILAASIYYIYGLATGGISSSQKWKDELIIGLWIFCLVLLSLSFTLLHGWSDFFVVKMFVNFGLETFIGGLLLQKTFLRDCEFEQFLDAIIDCAFIQCVFVVSMFLSSHVRELVFGLLSTNGADLYARYGGFRGLGLSGTLTYDLSIFFSICLILISYKVVSNKGNVLTHCFKFVLISFAIFMTGRSGIVGLIFALGLLFLNRSEDSMKFIKTLTLLCGGISLGFIISIALFKDSFILKKIWLVYRFAFELFINFFDTGRVYTRSTDKLLLMYFPISMKTFFWGDGLWLNPILVGYYKYTDSGFMRHVLFHGVIGSAPIYSFFIYLFRKMFLYSNKLQHFSKVVCVLAIYFVLAHFKGNFIVGSSLNNKFLMMLVFYLILHKKRLENLTY